MLPHLILMSACLLNGILVSGGAFFSSDILPDPSILANKDDDGILDQIKNIPQKIWDFFVDKVLGLLKDGGDWLSDQLRSLETKMDAFWAENLNVDEHSSSPVLSMSVNVITSLFYLLMAIVLIRVWVWVLDVVPMI